MLRKRFMLVVGAVLVAACAEGTPVGVPDDAISVGREHGRSVFDRVTIYRTPAPESGVPVGRSTLRRSRHGIAARLETTVIPYRSAVTVWIAVFNDPGACAASPCAASDFDAANGSLLRFTGRVVPGGRSRFRGHLRVGDVSEALFGPGLVDSFGAEIHFIVRTHGAPIPGLVREQITTPAGGCDVFITPELPDDAGECSDLAVAFHLPNGS